MSRVAEKLGSGMAVSRRGFFRSAGKQAMVVGGALGGLLFLMPQKARASISITYEDCTFASGSFDCPTTEVISCYFQGLDGTQYPAATISNNDPCPGEWNATDFADKPTQAVYYIVAVGDDGDATWGNPISC
jgi:hypothetical protein